MNMTNRTAFGGLFLALVCWLGTAWAQEERLEAGVNPGYHEPPEWFKASFLDLGEDVMEAREAGRRVLLYFYQDGCPYCAKLLEDNFGDPDIAATTREHFDVIAINMWGDRPVTDVDGEALTEKAYARKMAIKFTPTLVFLDESGEVVFRIDGYYHPGRFHHALRYAADAEPGGEGFGAYLARKEGGGGQGGVVDEPFFMEPPYLLDRRAGTAQRPLMVLFESPGCEVCREYHEDIFQRERTRKLLERFDVVGLDRFAGTPVLTPDGERTTAQAWAGALDVRSSPTLVFFDRQGEEVFRVGAYLKSFHMQSVLEYVASGAYREQPEFQRFVQERAERLEAAGEHVDIWD